MRVRAAVPADAQAVESLLREVHQAFGETPAEVTRLRAFVERALGPESQLTFLVAEDEAAGAAPAGLLSLAVVPTTLDAGEFVYLDDLYVRPASRGKGLARELLGAARRWAVARGALEVRLAADSRSENLWRLYRDAGYERQPMSWMVLDLGRDWTGRAR